MSQNWRLRLAIISFIVMVGSFVGFLSVRSGGLIGGGEGEAYLRLVPSGVAKVNQPFVVKVMGFSEKDNINSVGIYLRFDPAKLKVSEVDTLKSFCELYPEKKFDNRSGTISLACGAPHPGARGEMELMTITFLPQTEGSSQILVDANSALLRSDGKGTNLLKDYPTLEVSTGVSL